ncbi:hypothetical protein EWM64_g2758 [Hericium alpestre]|uniref:Uncharacterized protein n=1 Tax=Hericium alpestre TaxID=135208 RepID=A0A4Z0A6G0_9AGAM|nr:hypothetical protein EWM64_g2758 [Hericium alpestre]
MSYPSNSSTSNGVQAGYFSIPSQAIQSAIADHQHKAARVGKVVRGDEHAELQMQWHAAYAAFASGQMSSTEYDIVKIRILHWGNKPISP